MKLRKKMSGMSLLETILYLGIAVFVLGALFAYGWNVMAISVKSEVVQETVASGQLIGGRLRYLIRQAESVDRGSSVLNSAPAKLVLQVDGETVVIEDAGGQISIKRGTADPILLHPQEIRIDNLIFGEQVSVSSETEYVGFSFDAVADYPGSESRSEYQYALPFVSGSALRVSQ